MLLDRKLEIEVSAVMGHYRAEREQRKTVKLNTSSTTVEQQLNTSWTIGLSHHELNTSSTTAEHQLNANCWDQQELLILLAELESVTSIIYRFRFVSQLVTQTPVFTFDYYPDTTDTWTSAQPFIDNIRTTTLLINTTFYITPYYTLASRVLTRYVTGTTLDDQPNTHDK